MISKTLQKVFSILRTVKPMTDHDVVSLYRSLSVYRDFRPMWMGVMRNLHGAQVPADYTLESDLEDFYKFVLNDVAGALSHEETTFEDIETYHYGAGRSIYALSLLSHYGAIRKDQAKLLLKEVLLPEHIGVDLEIIVQNTSVLDEADTGALDAIVKQVLANNQKAVQEYLGGKDKAIGAIMGQVMRQMKADPQLVTETIKRLIAAG